MHTQANRTMSKADWSALTRPPVVPETAERPKGTGRKEKSFAFFIDGEWVWSVALTRSEACARVKERLKLERIPPGSSLKSRNQRRKRREPLTV